MPFQQVIDAKLAGHLFGKVYPGTTITNSGLFRMPSTWSDFSGSRKRYNHCANTGDHLRG